MFTAIFSGDKIVKAQQSQSQVKVTMSMEVDEYVRNKDSENKDGEKHRQKRRRE